jgi:HEAT repeat protein
MALLAIVACSTGSAQAPARVFDCTPWNVSDWWRFHRDALLPRVAAAPIPAAAREATADALRAALHATTNADLITSCAFALGRMGAANVPFDLQAELLPLAAHATQEVAETAVLALGVGGAAAAIAPLRALARDDADGRRLCGRDQVVDRTRAFAMYGLGFLARRLSTPPAQDAVLDVCAAVLVQAPADGRDLHVAAISALSLLAPPPADAPPWPQFASAVRALDAFAARTDGDLALAQAHVPTAIARLVGTARSARRSEAERVALEHRAQWLRTATALHDRPATRDFALQSALLALAATMPDDDAELARCAKVLAAVTSDADDPACLFFATFALGHTAGPVARARLLELLQGDSPQRRWAALALGVFERRARARAGAAATPDAGIASALTDALASTDPELVAAAAIGTGLADIDCAGPLRTILGGARDEGLLATTADAVRLRGDSGFVPDLRRVFAASRSRWNQHRATAEALAALGDGAVTAALLADIDAGPRLAATAAASLALGTIRDPAAAAPLLRMLRDDTSTPLTRAFAAVALGRIAAGEAAEWSAPLAHGTNWLAAVPTLTDCNAGVLDLL